MERRKLVTLPQVEFEAMVERAAERGARHALPEVGLDGRESPRDISELRSLLDAFNEAKKTAGLTIVRMLVTALVLIAMGTSRSSPARAANGPSPKADGE